MWNSLPFIIFHFILFFTVSFDRMGDAGIDIDEEKAQHAQFNKNLKVPLNCIDSDFCLYHQVHSTRSPLLFPPLLSPPLLSPPLLSPPLPSSSLPSSSLLFSPLLSPPLLSFLLYYQCRYSPSVFFFRWSALRSLSSFTLPPSAF